MKIKPQMKPTSKKEEAKNKIEELLSKIKEHKKVLEEVETQYKEELEQIKTKYYKTIEMTKWEIKKLEEELQKYALKHKHILFETDIVELQNGRLILQIKEAVKRVRNILANLEALGWTEAIIVEKKVNWAELEKWPDERLIAVGTERIKKEVVTYELK